MKWRDRKAHVLLCVGIAINVFLICTQKCHFLKKYDVGSKTSSLHYPLDIYLILFIRLRSELPPSLEVGAAWRCDHITTVNTVYIRTCSRARAQLTNHDPNVYFTLIILFPKPSTMRYDQECGYELNKEYDSQPTDTDAL